MVLLLLVRFDFRKWWLDSEVVKCSARILDNVATYLYFNQYKPTETVANIKRIMTSVLNAFIFGSANTIWDLSRPIYSVYLVKRDSLDHYLTNASANQTQQTVLQLMEDTKELTKDVDLAMGVTARDEFSKKATVWRRHFLSYMQLWNVCLKERRERKGGSIVFGRVRYESDGCDESKHGWVGSVTVVTSLEPQLQITPYLWNHCLQINKTPFW